jgi:hypothetical protein
VDELVRGKGTGNEITLGGVTPQLAEDRQLRFPFHALGGGIQAQSLGRGDDPGDQDRRGRVVIDGVNEGLVELQPG